MVVAHGFQCGPDPDPESETNADSCGSRPDLGPVHKKLIFYMKNIYKVGTVIGKNLPTKVQGTKAFHDPGSGSAFPMRYPGQQNECGS